MTAGQTTNRQQTDDRQTDDRQTEIFELTPNDMEFYCVWEGGNKWGEI
jgi:hypothetical protein